VDTSKPELLAKAAAMVGQPTGMTALRRLRLRWIGYLVRNPMW
jgi:hypothetical protein